MPDKDAEKRIVRIVKKKIPWASHLVNNINVALDLNIDREIETRTPKGSVCTFCKGAKKLCGKSKCPIIMKIYSYLKVKDTYERERIDGSSPPGVFVGRIGYPHVYIGPLVPPIHGNTILYDMPEEWFGKPIDEIIDLRFSLVRGKFRTDVRNLKDGGRLLEETKLLAMSEKSVDVELALKSKPKKLFVLNDEIQPIGPSALIKDITVGNFKLDQKIEKAYYDADLKASEAILELYEKGIAVSKIQKALSVGALGVKGQRKLVPTRWSITASDSIISQTLINRVKDFPLINEFRVYESNYLDNRFEIIMIPQAWRYEAMEAWYPGTIWNPSDKEIYMITDWEDRKGRTTYAKMGGCYYAARLAVNEILQKEKRQATAFVLREAHPGYIMPVGVWQVRENVRNALKQSPLKFNSLKEALGHVEKRFDIELKIWIKNSKLLKDTLTQKKITEFFKEKI